jgi:hypothetical protein
MDKPAAYINEEDGLVCAKCYKPFTKELTDDEIIEIAHKAYQKYKNWHYYQIEFAKAILEAASKK